MSNEKKQSATEKIDKILDRLTIPEAIEVYKKSGENLHTKIEKQEKELSEYKSKLGK